MSDKQTQMQMMQLAQQKNQLMMPLIEQRMNEELFPMENVSDEWIEIMADAVRKIQPYSVKAKLQDFASLIMKLESKIPKLSLNDFQIMANSLDVISIEQLELGVYGYKPLVDETFKLIAIWQKKIKIINDEVTIEVETKLQMERAAQNGLSIVKE
jgi:hypothetical protein